MLILVLGKVNKSISTYVRKLKEILIKLLTKRFGKVPDGYSEKICKLPQDTIDVIATGIFDLERIEEIERYI